MTNALNLALLGNNVNSSGQVSLTAGVSGTLPASSGGTGITSPGASGNVLISNGTAWTSAATPYVGARAQVFTSSGTFTVPTGVTAVKVTVIGAGGGSGGAAPNPDPTNSSGGGGGGTAIKWVTGLTPGNTVTVTVGTGGTAGTSAPTVGGAGGTSSFGAFCSATGGGGGGSSTTGTVGTSGSGSGGDLNFNGVRATPATSTNTFAQLGGQAIMLSKGGLQPASIPSNGIAGTGYGAGAGGAYSDSFFGSQSGAAGTGGVVIVEW